MCEYSSLINFFFPLLARPILWMLESFSAAFARGLHSLPNNKILDWSKLKVFADNTVNATQKLKFVLGGIENEVGKGENDGYQHFLLFPQCFQKAPSHGR